MGRPVEPLVKNAMLHKTRVQQSSHLEARVLRSLEPVRPRKRRVRGHSPLICRRSVRASVRRTEQLVPQDGEMDSADESKSFRNPANLCILTFFNTRQLVVSCWNCVAKACTNFPITPHFPTAEIHMYSACVLPSMCSRFRSWLGGGVGMPRWRPIFQQGTYVYSWLFSLLYAALRVRQRRCGE